MNFCTITEQLSLQLKMVFKDMKIITLDPAKILVKKVHIATGSKFRYFFEVKNYAK